MTFPSLVNFIYCTSLKFAQLLHFYHNVFTSGYHQFFLNLSHCFPSPLHASVPTICFPDSSQTVLLKSKNTNYTTLHFETIKWLSIGLRLMYKIPNHAFKAYGGSSSPFLSHWSKHSKLPVSSVHVVPSPGRNHIMADQLLTVASPASSTT